MTFTSSFINISALGKGYRSMPVLYTQSQCQRLFLQVNYHKINKIDATGYDTLKTLDVFR